MDFYAGDEKQVKKAMSLIMGRGLGELEMFAITDLFEEWWALEKRKRAGATENWKKARKAKSIWNKQDEKKYQAWRVLLSP